MDPNSPTAKPNKYLNIVGVRSKLVRLKPSLHIAAVFHGR